LPNAAARRTYMEATRMESSLNVWENLSHLDQELEEGEIIEDEIEQKLERSEH
jgi:hypothetical protein